MVIDEDQFLDILLIIQRFILLSRRQSYIRIRPQAAINAAPQEWITFVFKSALKRIREENYKRTIEYIMERREIRREYLELYKCKMSGRMGNLERTRLDELDKTLQYEDIRIFRMLAPEGMPYCTHLVHRHPHRIRNHHGGLISGEHSEKTPPHPNPEQKRSRNF